MILTATDFRKKAEDLNEILKLNEVIGDKLIRYCEIN